MRMVKQINVYNNFSTHEKEERERRKALSPEERLNEVELLRLEGGKFLYEYPTRFRRIIKITRR